MDSLERFNKLAPADRVSNIVITGNKYGEDVGYYQTLVVKTISGKSYNVSENGRLAILEASRNGEKFVQLGDDSISLGQITGIYKDKTYFGPREGGYE